MADLIIRTETGSKIVREGSNTIVGDRIVSNPRRRSGGGGSRKSTVKVEQKATTEEKPEEIIKPEINNQEVSKLRNQFNIIDYARQKQEQERLGKTFYYPDREKDFPINNLPVGGLKDFKYKPTRIYTPTVEDEYKDFVRQKRGVSQETIKERPAVFEEVYKESFNTPEETPYNKVEEIPQAKNYSDYINRYLPEVNKVQRKGGNVAEQIFSKTIVAGTLGAIRGVGNFVNPETYKPKNLLRPLYDTNYYKDLLNQFGTDPFGTTAEFYTGAKIIKTGGEFLPKATKILTPFEKISSRIDNNRFIVDIDYISLNKKGVSRTRGTSQKIPFKQENIAQAQSGRQYKQLQKSLQYPSGQYAVSGKVKVGNKIFRDFQYLEPKTPKPKPSKVTIDLSTGLDYSEYRSGFDPYTTLGTLESKPLSKVRLTGKDLSRAEQKLKTQVKNIFEEQRQTDIARRLELLKTQITTKRILKNPEAILKPDKPQNIIEGQKNIFLEQTTQKLARQPKKGASSQVTTDIINIEAYKLAERIARSKNIKPSKPIYSKPLTTVKPSKTNLKVVVDNIGQQTAQVTKTVNIKPLSEVRPKVSATVSEPAQTPVYSNKYVARTVNPEYLNRQFRIPEIDNKLFEARTVKPETSPIVVQKPTSALSYEYGLQSSNLFNQDNIFKDASISRDISSFDISLSSDNIIKPDTTTKPDLAIKQDTVTDNALIQETVTEPFKPVITETKRRRSTPQTPKIVNPVVLPKKTVYKPPKPPKTPQIKIKEPKRPFLPPKPLYTPQTDKKRVLGYNVFVRRKGVFGKVNIKPLKRQEALSFGAFRVGTTAGASFKLEPVKTSSLGKYSGGLGNLKDFKIKKGVYIEKRSRRIKSLGELKEITFKGISSRKGKKSNSNKIKKLWGA